MTHQIRHARRKQVYLYVGLGLFGILLVMAISAMRRIGNPSTMEEIAVQHREVMNQFPPAAGYHSIRKQLVAAAQRENLVSSEGDVVTQLIEKYPNEPTGLFLLGCRVYEAEQRSTDEAIALCKSIRDKHAQHAVGAFALQRELSITQSLSRQKFIQVCDSILQDPNTSRRFREVILISRIQLYRDVGAFKDAALDGLRLWLQDPERIRALELDLTISGLFEISGFIMEKELAGELKANSGEILDALRREMHEGLDEDTNDLADSLFKVYLDTLPDIDALLSYASGMRSPPTSAFALFSARSILSATEKRVPPDRIVPIAMAYISTMNVLVEQLPERDLLLHEAVLELVLRRVQRLRDNLYGSYSNTENTTVEPSAATLKLLSGAAEKMALLHFALQNRESLRRQPAAEEQLKVLRETEKKYREWGYFALVEELYKQFLALNVDPKAESQALFQLADFNENTLQNYSYAATVFSGLADMDIDGSMKNLARLRAARCLLRVKQHMQARTQLLVALNSTTDPAHATAALFLLAQCEDWMGLKASADSRIQDLLTYYPNNESTPKAVFWWISRLLLTGDTEHARILLEEFLLQFPNSSHASDAKRYLQELKSHASSSSL